MSDAKQVPIWQEFDKCIRDLEQASHAVRTAQDEKALATEELVRFCINMDFIDCLTPRLSQVYRRLRIEKSLNR